MPRPIVSIRELKSRLSHYLRLAREGEAIVITNRGVPIGRLVPFGQDLDQRLAALQEAGVLHWSGCKPGRRRPVGRAAAGRSVADLIIDDR